MATTTFIPTTSTTVSPLQIVKMEIAYVCEMSALIIHVAMIAGFFYLLRDAEKEAQRQVARFGTRPRELNQNMIYLSASVLVLGLMYNIAVLIENSLVKDCTKPWVHYNELTWMMLHRASLLSVYLYRLDTCFRGSIFAYPKWFINALAGCIVTWTLLSIGLNMAFYGAAEVDVRFRTGANGKTMCSWDLAADGIFYGSRIPEFCLTILLLSAFLYKLWELHNLSSKREERKPDIEQSPGGGRVALGTVDNGKEDTDPGTFETELSDVVRSGGLDTSALDPSEEVTTPTINTVVAFRQMASLSLSDSTKDADKAKVSPKASDLEAKESTKEAESDKVEDEVDAVELTAMSKSRSTSKGSVSGKQSSLTDKGSVSGKQESADSKKTPKKKRVKRRRNVNRTQAYQIVFRRVAISTTIAIMSTYVVILGYNFFPPLSGFMSFDVCLNGFCVMAMFKFCQFLVKPMFGTRCQRCCCLQMVDKRGNCQCRFGKDTGTH